MYVELIFPLPFQKSFSYRVPEKLEEQIVFGKRAVASFGKRILTGFIVEITDKPSIDDPEKIKEIIDVIDDVPIFNKNDLSFYNWIADYYISSPGEALKLSDPYGTEIRSQKVILSDQEFVKAEYEKLKSKHSLKARLLEILIQHPKISLNRVLKMLDKKSMKTTLQSLEEEGILTVFNDIGKPKVSEKTQKFVEISANAEDVYTMMPEIEKRSEKQVSVLLKLMGSKKPIALAELSKSIDISQNSIKSLENKGLIKIFDKHIERTFNDEYSETIPEITLTSDQQNIVNTVLPHIENGAFKPFLLHGVTGSGKTQVYIELIKKVLAIGKTALILVPEISLTPQMTTRLHNHFREDVTVIHSRMSMGERFDSWRKVLLRKCSVVTGARSALFAPLNNIGLIVVDEEHDSSYKQYDKSPRYHARDAAVVRAHNASCPIILGSATPSVESMYNAETKKYELLELKNRIDDAKLPHIRLLNVVAEKKKKRMEGTFGTTLLEKMDERLRKNEGVIILQNRRGYSTQIYCVDCGEIEMCDDCSVAMVFHIEENRLRCHYCGSVRQVPRRCKHCKSINLKYFGAGTERIEEELEYYFPNAAIARIDSDSIQKKGALGKILTDFKEGEIDILVGTQMVAKGLDFSRVTLVGVIAAENSLWFPDFRADERTFQLLTQVAGRAGRSKNPGEVVIQTQDDRHFVLQKVLQHDYEGFYKKEIVDRQARNYPPFSHLCLVEVRDRKDEKAKGALTDFYKQIIPYRKVVHSTPPSLAVIGKLRGEYRYQLLLRSSRKDDPSGSVLRKAIEEAYIQYTQQSQFRDIRIMFDMNPQSVL